MAYATRADLASLGLPSQALADVSDAVQDDHLDAASSVIDSYLASQYSLPLANTPDILRVTAVCIASYTVLVWRGFNPDAYDANFREKYEGCIDWLKAVAAGAAQVPGIEDATPETNEGAPKVRSRTSRGWYASDGSRDDIVP